MNVCVNDVLRWTGIPIQDAFLLYPQCSQDRLLIHLNPYQDRAVTEDEDVQYQLKVRTHLLIHTSFFILTVCTTVYSSTEDLETT